MTTDEAPDAPLPRTRRRAWLWVAAAALLVLAPAGWLGAEYAIDNAEMERIRSELDAARALIDRASSAPAESGEGDACERAARPLSELTDPPWWRHVAFSLLEEQQVQAAVRRLDELRKTCSERSANRSWWTGQSASVDAALAAEGRTIPDLLALRDSVDSAQPPHPQAGGAAPDARAALLARIDADAAALTDAQDRLLRSFVAAGERVAQATDLASLDAALASAPGSEARDLNPPELDAVRERLNSRAERIRGEIALRAALEASVAGALSKALALDPETAAAGDAYAIVSSVESIAVPEGVRYAALADAKSQAIEVARRRLALLEARDRDRAWLDAIAAAEPGASTARDAQALLERLQEDPPGGCDLPSVARRSAEIRDSLRARLQSRRDMSRSWREELAGAADALVAARTLESFAAAARQVDELLALGSGDPSSAEDAQADRAAREVRRATAERIVRSELAPVADAVRRTADPRELPTEAVAALSPESPLASMEEAKDAIAALRAVIDARLAEYEAFDGAIERARTALQEGDACAAAEALADARARTAEQEWTRNDLRGAIAEMALERVESLVLVEGARFSGTLPRLERIAQCAGLEACAPDAMRMAARVLSDVRLEADRALWEECRRTAREALERRDASTYVGALTRYLATRGSMQADARAALDAFAAPASRVVASEFVWGATSCLPADAIGDITITVDGDTWAGPIPAGEPGRAARLSHEWTVRSGSDAIVVSASGVSPCEDPQPFAGLAEVPLNSRRFGANLEIPCPAVGAGAGESGHTLRVKVTPSTQWLAALRLPEWRTPDGTTAGEPAEQETVPVPLRPESDAPAFTEPTPADAPR